MPVKSKCRHCSHRQILNMSNHIANKMATIFLKFLCRFLTSSLWYRGSSCEISDINYLSQKVSWIYIWKCLSVFGLWREHNGSAIFTGPLNPQHGVIKGTVLEVEIASLTKHLILLSNKLVSEFKSLKKSFQCLIIMV